jgi:hypothetical protein
MAEFDVDAFVSRFRNRAAAVRERGIPPIEGEARRKFIESAELDFTDYSLIASGSWTIDEGALVLRIPLEGD